MTLTAGTPVGKYVIRRKLAEGGMAEIYLATIPGAEGFEKELVIKQVRAYLASDPGFVEMFIAEARVASRLNHPNLVQVFGFDKHENTYFLAMEYVRGRSLWDARKRAKAAMRPMRPVLVAHVGAEVARGLSYAHRVTDKGRPLNLVHRDVTPHNVLLSFDGAVKLTDFGVAKASSSAQTAAGVLKGKFAYMSPEQAQALDVDARTDVFALGIVLWEMLTGGRLFDGDTDVAVLKAVRERVIPNPARLNPDVPPDLDAAVMRALERDRDARFQSAAELERALGEVLLRNAKTLEDRDVGAYLRELFPEEADEDAREASRVSGPQTPSPARREPTAVMPRRGVTPPSPSPDEDGNASTHVLDRERRATPSPHAAQGAPTIEFPPFPPGSVAASAAAGQATPASVPTTPAVARRPLSSSVKLAIVGGASLVLVALGVALGSTLGAAMGEGSAPAQVPATAAVAPAPVATPSGPAPVATPSGPAAAPELPAASVTVATAVDAGTVVAASAVDSPDAGVLAEPAVARAAAPAVATGTLVVTAIPYATMFLDGGRQAREVARRKQFKLSVGRHRVVLEHPKGTREFDVTISANKRTEISHNFLE